MESPSITPITPSEESLNELLRRTEITSKIRYSAARRMALHRAFSQWTLAILAVGQIVISLIIALKLTVNFNQNYIEFGTIFFGILVLAYSLLLGMGDFSARAIKLHSCGIELGNLSRILHLQCRNPKSSDVDYINSANKYYEILAKCENHIGLDFLITERLETKRKVPVATLFKKLLSKDFTNTLIDLFTIAINYLSSNVQIWILKTFQFGHYLASILLIGSWIYALSLQQL